MSRLLTVITFIFIVLTISSQDYNLLTEDGTISRIDDIRTKRDSANQVNKEIPKGFHTWTISPVFGDIEQCEPDTASFLFMNTTLTTGREREHDFLGNLGSPRYHRTLSLRPDEGDFVFTSAYDYFIKPSEDFHFINTLSPITNISFNTCGDRTNGEDHLKALFAVNANKRLGVGFIFDYLYGRGYYQNQSSSHFNYTMFGSYLGERYQSHLILSLNHQKMAENGGIVSDDYITHPESFNDNYSENEIPTVLSENWNRNDNQHLLFTHRYNFGFQQKVAMTEEEIKARQFAIEAEKEKRERQQKVNNGEYDPTINDNDTDLEANNNNPNDDQEWTKTEYVPVTSIIHTLEFDNYRRIYQAYQTPENYYSAEFYNIGRFTGDSIYDKTRHYSLKNTLAIAMLEGFNKWAKAGIKLYTTHKFNHYSLPNTSALMESTTEQSLFIGGQIRRTSGKRFNFNVNGSLGVAGSDLGDFGVDAEIDFNVPLFKNDLEVALNGSFNREQPSFYYRHFQSRHAWWNNDDLNTTIKNQLSLDINYPHSGTHVTLSLNNIKNYTFFETVYNLSDENYRLDNRFSVGQKTGNISVFGIKLRQDVKVKLFNMNVSATYQTTSDKIIMPLPELDLWVNMFLRFKIAKVLNCDLGSDMRYFTEFYAPEYIPYLSHFAINTNEATKTKIGNYPFINVYANFQLKNTRFFVMAEHVNAGSGNKGYFLTPHYPTNGRVIRFGLSWNFFN